MEQSFAKLSENISTTIIVNFASKFSFQSDELSRYLTFCPDYFGNVGKRLDKKAMVNFKRMRNK